MTAGMWRERLICVLLGLTVVGAFANTLRNDFINFDDPGYVYENPRVLSGVSLANARWAFTAVEMQNWHPLTWLSHQVDAQLFGVTPAGHHLTSVVLHACNAVLLFVFLSSATGHPWRAAFVAALFALHPLRVESVAWIAERKDVLSGFFCMLTLLAYSSYRARGGATRYGLVMLAFGAGLMAKPMLVTLPLVLLLLDYWPFPRLALQGARRDAPRHAVGVAAAAVEKLPLVVMAAVSAIVTLHAQRAGDAIASLIEVPMRTRLENACVSIVRYVLKTIYPVDLSIVYPLEADLPAWHVAAAFVAIIAVSVLALASARGRPYLAVGWLWYLATLSPVIGIVQVGAQSMADRYTYLPSIGLFVMMVWGAAEVAGESRRRTALIVGAGAGALSILAVLTFFRVSDWKDSVTIFSRSVQVTEENLLAHQNLGIALARKGRDGEAAAHYREAMRIAPGFAEPYYSLGNVMMRAQRYDDALKLYGDAVRLQPAHALAHNNAGIVLGIVGRHADAIVAFQHAVRLRPESAGVHYNLAVALLRDGRKREAAWHCAETLRLQPRHDHARALLQSIVGR